MAEATPRATAIWVGLYLGLALLIVFGQLLPLQTMPRTWAMPDLLLALTLGWIARRPEVVPLLAVALVFLAADLLFQRPPGLMTGLVLIATELLRSRAPSLKAATFYEEWGSAALCILGITAVYQATLALTLLPTAPLSLSVTQALATILAYPVVISVSWALFGLRRPRPGDARKGLAP